MDFVNNWSRPVTLAAGATSLALDLPDGNYLLTIADSLAGATRWEITDAAVSAGIATLTRGVEATGDQSWFDGSVIYCSLTAGSLSGIESRIATLEEGGADGRGIANASVNVSGHLIIEYTDGATVDAGYVVGSDGDDGLPGADGNDGRGVTSTSVDVNGDLIITYSDGSTQNAGNVTNGVDGQDGADGRGIASATINANGELVITYTDSTTANVGMVRGSDGADGTNGADGADGLSAYEVWLAQGNSGSEAVYLESLKGVKGDTGASGTYSPPAVVSNASTTITLALTDLNTYIRTTSASAVTITVPPQSDVAWTANAEIFIEQGAAGAVSFAAGAGVTINKLSTNNAKIAGQYGVASLKRTAQDAWTLFGALEVAA